MWYCKVLKVSEEKVWEERKTAADRSEDMLS